METGAWEAQSDGAVGLLDAFIESDDLGQGDVGDTAVVGGPAGDGGLPLHEGKGVMTIDGMIYVRRRV